MVTGTKDEEGSCPALCRARHGAEPGFSSVASTSDRDPADMEVRHTVLWEEPGLGSRYGLVPVQRRFGTEGSVPDLSDADP